MSASYFDLLAIRLASGLGILQGLTWVGLSLACIIVYNLELNLQTKSYMDIVNYCIYLYIFYDDQTYFADRTVNNNLFFAFAIIHLILNATWFLSSTYLYFCNLQKVGEKIVYWSYLTLLISAWDLINVIIFGTDYHKCIKSLPAGVSSEFICANGILPILVIAARGFTLWCLNVTFAVVVHSISKKLTKRVEGQVSNNAYLPSNGAWYGQQQVRPDGPFLGNVPYALPPPPIQKAPAPPPPPQNFQKTFNYPYIPDPDYNDVLPRRQF